MPQVRIGWRPNTTQSQSVSTLIASLYGAWNGEAATNELDKSLFGSWNGDSTGTSSLKTSIHGVWNGESNANDSYGSKNGSIVGSVTYTAGKIGNSFTFNGSNSYVTLPSGTLEFTGDFSVSLWFNGSSVSGEKQIISNANKVGGASGQWKGWDLFIYGGKVYYRLWNSGTNSDAISSTTISGSTWYHVVITKSGSVQKLYINGALEATNSSAVTPNYTTPNFPAIGVQYYHSGIGYDTPTIFNGRIDAVAAWTKELTLSEISELYNSGNGAQYIVDNFYKPTASDALGANSGTAQGGLTYDVGKLGAAFQFNGTNAYVSLPDDIFNFTGDFSASAWFYTPSAAYAHAGIVGNYNWGTKTGWGIYTYQNRLYANIYNVAGDYSTVYIDNSVVGAWNHVAMVFKKGTGFYLYMNGDLKNSFTLTNNANAGYSPVYATGQKARIGLMNYSGDWWYAGNGYKIDGVNVWQRAISRDDVVQLYNSGTGAQYPFTGTFSSAANALGMDNGTLMNGCYLSDGKIGKAFTFDGVNDYVQLPNNSLNLTTFSISAWVNPSNTVGSRTILNSANYVSALDYGWKFRIIDGQLSLQIYSTGGLINEYKGGSISTNTWTHVSATRINGSTKLYINGSLVGSQTSGSINNNPNFTTTTYCSIGSLTSAVSPISFFIGSIDSLSVWQKELTQAEVTELYNSGNGKQITATPIVQSGLILNLDAYRKSSYTGTGTTWTDISGSGNSGTFIGNPTYNNSDSTFTFSNSNYIKSTTGGVTGNTTRTVSIWFKINGLASNDSNWSVTDQIPFSLGSTTGGNLSFAINISYYAGGNTIMKVYGYFTQYDEEITISGDNLGNNQWRNITVTWNGLNPGTLGVYIDGVFKTSLLRSSGEVYNTSAGYIVGTWADYNRYYTNKLGSVLVYNRVLTSNEILQNYNATKSRFGL